MKRTIPTYYLMLLSVLLMLGSCNTSTTYSSVDAMVDEALLGSNPIDAESLKKLIDDGEMILLLDVREPNEFNAGYIPGGVNIPRGTLEFKIGNEAFWEAEMLYMPEKEEPIIVYCKKGKRSILAAKTLKQLGYTNIQYLDGGWKKWELTYPLIFEKNLDQMHHEDEGEVGGC